MIIVVCYLPLSNLNQPLTEKYVSTLCAGSLCGVHSVVVSTLGRNLRVPGSIPGEHTPPTFPNCDVVAACGDVPTI